MDREAIKAQMIQNRKINNNGRVPCDFCRVNRGTEMHELIYRALTIHNPEARELSFQPELCSLLCRACHSKAHKPHIRSELFLVNYRIYGQAAVKKAFNRILGVTHLYISLPESASNV